MQSSPVHVVAVQAMFQRLMRDSTRHHRSCARRIDTTGSRDTGSCSGCACVRSGASLQVAHIRVTIFAWLYIMQARYPCSHAHVRCRAELWASAMKSWWLRDGICRHEHWLCSCLYSPRGDGCCDAWVEPCSRIMRCFVAATRALTLAWRAWRVLECMCSGLEKHGIARGEV